MQVTVAEARAKLAHLIDAAMAGKRVVIARRRRAVVELRPVTRPETGPFPELRSFRANLINRNPEPITTVIRDHERN